MKGRIEIDKETCKGCGLCITVCPKKLIEVSDYLNTKGYYPASFKGIECSEDKKLQCTGCALCAITCPDIAIEVYRDKKEPTQAGDSASEEG
ncbi:MAG: 4Fe-4S dicluster domain-containing protein [Thermodesulfobacteriota bacterium]